MIVLHDVEEEGGHCEVSDGHLVSHNELVSGLGFELILNHLKELAKQAVLECLDTTSFLVFSHEEDLGESIEDISVGLNKHVNHAS